jgi:BirA family biotin operon repressor/biotin-[acetyl-CoA-carboxylase] ligase
METLFIGRQRFDLDELESTNVYAQDLIRHGLASEGASIVVRSQRKGRGQRGASWESEPGKNLTVSIVLLPSFLTSADQFFLSRISALALTDLISALPGMEQELIRIKWPNDIYAGNRKLAGILIENSWRGAEMAASVIGIGLNINQEMFHTAPQAVSLLQIGKRTYPLREVEDLLYACLEARYLQLRAGKKEAIFNDYHNLLYRLGEWHVYYKGQEPFNACITGVTREGKLRMKLDIGAETLFDLKEVRFSNLS